MAEQKEITVEECREHLEEWLERAAINPTHNKYDELCGVAYRLLPEGEYKRIYDRWAGNYVMCPDGNYRRWH